MWDFVHVVNQCWSCSGNTGGGLFCPHCKSLQPPSTDYFTLFGIKTALNLDVPALQKRFYELSRQVHPDRFTRHSERERQFSLDASALLNDAWRVLRDPVERAEYVLKQNGLDIGEQGSKDVPPELLEEVFELNMALEELREGDTAARSQLVESEARFGSIQQGIDLELDHLFTKHDAATADARKVVLSEIRGVLNRRCYIANLIRDVEKELHVNASN